ncbi:MAG TPA: hypothetical protein VFN08_11185 [Gemmatimonadales bacterium]|nr:hypothetical protein [Gemmatimonadales bacterium]
MEVGPLVVLGLMWVVLNALRKGGSRPSGGPGKPSSNLPSASRLPGDTRPTAGPTRRSGEAPPLGATQREGSQLEQLLRELGRTLDQGGQQSKQPTVRTLPPTRMPSPAKPPRKGGSLVPASEGQSLELDPGRPEPQVEDLDDEAEKVVEERRAAAEANLRPLSGADHRLFDDRIRQEPADQTAARAYTLKQLREAVVWREILGPPVSLREPSDW